MATEKANEPLRWKDKLDQPAWLPGESLTDTEASWNRLHERLQQKPVAKRRAVYRAAAACLLVVSVIGWLMPEQHRGTLVKNKIQPTPVTAMQSLPSKGPGGTVTATQPVTTKEYTIRSGVKSRLLHPDFSHAVLAVRPVAVGVNSAHEPPPVITVNIIQPTDTIHLTAAAPAKKMRVVHINMLGTGSEESQIAGNNPTLYPQAKLSNSDDLSRFSISKNTSDNILKIKLSSSN